MTLISFEEFKQYFSDRDGIIFGSPNLKMICNGLKLNREYISVQDAFETTEKYSSLLMDINDGKTFPGIRVGGEYQWIKKAIMSLDDDGVLYCRVPTYLISKLYNISNVHIDQIEMLKDYCYIDITKKVSKEKTVVKYPEKIIEIDINKPIILDSYNEEFYSYLNNVDLSKSCHRTTIDGKGSVLKDQLTKRSNRSDFENIIFLSSTTSYLKCQTFDEVKDRNIGGDAFFTNSIEERNKYIETVSNKKVHQLIMSMCFGNYVRMKLDHKKYIFNENIFKFVS